MSDTTDEHVEMEEFTTRGIALEAGNAVVTASTLKAFAERVMFMFGEDAEICLNEYSLRAVKSEGAGPIMRDWLRRERR